MIEILTNTMQREERGTSKVTYFYRLWIILKQAIILFLCLLQKAFRKEQSEGY